MYRYIYICTYILYVLAIYAVRMLQIYIFVFAASSLHEGLVSRKQLYVLQEGDLGWMGERKTHFA